MFFGVLCMPLTTDFRFSFFPPVFLLEPVLPTRLFFDGPGTWVNKWRRITRRTGHPCRLRRPSNCGSICVRRSSPETIIGYVLRAFSRRLVEIRAVFFSLLCHSYACCQNHVFFPLSIKRLFINRHPVHWSIIVPESILGLSYIFVQLKSFNQVSLP